MPVWQTITRSLAVLALLGASVGAVFVVIAGLDAADEPDALRQLAVLGALMVFVALWAALAALLLLRRLPVAPLASVRSATWKAMNARLAAETAAQHDVWDGASPPSLDQSVEAARVVATSCRQVGVSTRAMEADIKPTDPIAATRVCDAGQTAMKCAEATQALVERVLPTTDPERRKRIDELRDSSRAAIGQARDAVEAARTAVDACVLADNQ